MANLRKKTELVKFLKKLDKGEFLEAGLINDIISELENIKASIPPEQNLSPYFQSVKTLEDKYSTITNSIMNLSNSISMDFQKYGSNTDLKINNLSKETTKLLKSYKDELEKIRLQVLEIGGRGGGSNPLQVRNNGIPVNTRYADINLIGSGVTITTVNDDVKKTTNITFTGGGALTILPATGTIDDSNTSFTFSSLPTLINVNGAFYKQTGGAIAWTWNTGTLTATLSSVVGVNGSIFGI